VTPFVFSNERKPPSPSIPISTGIMTDVSACGTTMPSGDKSGLTKKLIAMPTTQTHATAGLQED